ncbi:sensor histidine kinase [Hymenobacter algoricola]|uniref:Signal transduction histidine kinase internal region domain-containing protein n=1 Tax=Hymenobacter algoricola TaxID=486267 RepID=A0ABP7M9Q9_9BACT
MRKKPWFYVFVFGLSVLMAVFIRLTMAPTAADFHLFPDAPIWIFLQVLLGIYLLDKLHARWQQRGHPASSTRYYFRLLLVGGTGFLLLSQGLSGAAALLPMGQPWNWSWYGAVRSLLSDVFLYLLVSGVYLPFLYQQHAAANAAKVAQLEKEAVRARLLGLQQHVEPHFLFNNLNILAALIEPANAAAHDYVTHLAGLYRYLVQTREQELVPVAQEVAFARDYCYLLTKRFGAAYCFEESLHLTSDELQNLLVPPGVLQELLTNAVKHNLASRARPLQIYLTIAGTTLTLRNNRQVRPEPGAGARSGLPGLRARLALFTDTPAVVDDEADFFAVSLPLLSPLALADYATPDSGR